MGVLKILDSEYDRHLGFYRFWIQFTFLDVCNVATNIAQAKSELYWLRFHSSLGGVLLNYQREAANVDQKNYRIQTVTLLGDTVGSYSIRPYAE